MNFKAFCLPLGMTMLVTFPRWGLSAGWPDDFNPTKITKEMTSEDSRKAESYTHSLKCGKFGCLWPVAENHWTKKYGLSLFLWKEASKNIAETRAFGKKWEASSSGYIKTSILGNKKTLGTFLNKVGRFAPDSIRDLSERHACATLEDCLVGLICLRDVLRASLRTKHFSTMIVASTDWQVPREVQY